VSLYGYARVSVIDQDLRLQRFAVAMESPVADNGALLEALALPRPLGHHGIIPRQ
jgi:hypothetical protein